jgi:hypothetical protein
MTTNPARFNRVSQWLQQRQLRVLENAYTAACEIKVLEEQYNEGRPITYTSDQSKTVYDYVRSLRDRKLIQVRANLTQFRLNTFLLNQSPGNRAEPADAVMAQDESVIEKLNFIESVISRYRESPDDELAKVAAMMDGEDGPIEMGTVLPQVAEKNPRTSVAEVVDPVIIETETDKQRHRGLGFLGGSLLGRKPDPKYEQKVVLQLRLERKQNQVAVRWLAILILVPLLIGFLSRHVLFGPLLGTYADRNPNQIELSEEIQKEFGLELLRFRETLAVQELLGIIPELSAEERRDRMTEKATELWQEAREAELNGLKNLLADLVAVGTFAGLVYFNRNRLKILRSATNRTFLSLSNPVKVFLFILVTDMFVGFHSAEGWSVILNGVGRHFGLPENEAAVGMFIATVPVFLDSCIKFWIFTYLTRYSPASSAVYERMNT